MYPMSRVGVIAQWLVLPITVQKDAGSIPGGGNGSEMEFVNILSFVCFLFRFVLISRDIVGKPGTRV